MSDPTRRPDRDRSSSDHSPDAWLCMIFSEKRYPRFGIMHLKPRRGGTRAPGPEIGVLAWFRQGRNTVMPGLVAGIHAFLHPGLDADAAEPGLAGVLAVDLHVPNAGISAQVGSFRPLAGRGREDPAGSRTL